MAELPVTSTGRSTTHVHAWATLKDNLGQGTPDPKEAHVTLVPFALYLPGLLVAAFVLNIICGIFGGVLNGLLFLDTIGTALAAIAAGPWWGATIGALTNLVISQFPCKQHYFNYLVVNVLCGIMWGYLGRGWPGLFRRPDSYRRLFFMIWVTGVAVGLVAAVISLVTTFNFVWYLSEVDPETFRRWHLTDEYYRWLLKTGDLDPTGTILQVMVRDVIAILPDKVVSVALASFLVYYALPAEYVAPGTKGRDKFVRAETHSFFVFTAVYIGCYALIIDRGNLSIDPDTCLVNGSTRHVSQVLLWSVPLVMSFFLVIRAAISGGQRVTRIGAVAVSDSKKKYVKYLYYDVLAMLAGVFSLLLTYKQGSRVSSSSPAHEISILLGDGLGMLAFFGVFGFVPGFFLRILGIDPEMIKGDPAIVRGSEPEEPTGESFNH